MKRSILRPSYSRLTRSSTRCGIIGGISCSMGRFPGGVNTSIHLLTLLCFSSSVVRLSSPQEINDILSSELHITTTALKQHPKVYWIWNHRRWCLASIPDVPQPAAVDEQEQGQASTEPAEVDSRGWQKAAWDREMYIVEKMLDADPRNCTYASYSHPPTPTLLLTTYLVHAWNYRRYILSESPTPRPLSAELAYTTKKIESNFSNFSAWHQRSKVYAQMWESGEADVEGSKEAGERVLPSQ